MFFLQTDASERGMGAVLYQEREDGTRRIISYASAKFNPTEQRYHCNEQECLAIIWAIKKFRPYLEDRSFVIRTDSKILTWLDRFKDTRGKLTRWALLLQEFDFKIEHCPGKNNELPDLLSRNPEGTHEELDDAERMVPPERKTRTVNQEPAVYQIGTSKFIQELQDEQQLDIYISGIHQQILTIQSKARRNEQETTFLQKHMFTEGIIWKRDGSNKSWKIIVPKTLIQRVLFMHHDSEVAGHPGMEETLREIQKYYRWAGMIKDVQNHVRLCHMCANYKKGPGGQTNLRPHQPRRPWETVAVDLMGPYPMTSQRKRFILVATDLFSRWVEAFPLSNSNTSTITKTLEVEVFKRWGYPRAILSDNGPQFVSKEWKEACSQWQAELWTTAIYHPQANPSERRNQELKKGLRLHLHERQHKEWDQGLPNILFQLRTRRNAATGVSPSWILTGATAQKPGEWKLAELQSSSARKERVAKVQKHQEEYQKVYQGDDQASYQFKVGDWVYLKTHPLPNKAEGFHSGLAAKWEGPFQIIQQQHNIYFFRKNDEMSRVHQGFVNHRGRTNKAGTSG